MITAPHQAGGPDKPVQLDAQYLQPAATWSRPTPDAIKLVLRQAGFSGKEAAAFLGLGQAGGRSVRRWTANEDATPIPYAAWALLCDAAGYRSIWRQQQDDGKTGSTPKGSL